MLASSGVCYLFVSSFSERHPPLNPLNRGNRYFGAWTGVFRYFPGIAQSACGECEDGREGGGVVTTARACAFVCVRLSLFCASLSYCCMYCVRAVGVYVEV